MADLEKVRLWDLLPPSIRDDPEVQALAQGIHEELAAIHGDIDRVLLNSRIDELPEAILDALAWQRHVDYYEPVGMALAKKRAVVKGSIAWHRKKGTPWAVKQVLSAIFAESEVVEWFQYQGRPFRFKIRTTDTLTSDEDYASLTRAIQTVKNTRSRLDGIEIQRRLRLGEGLFIGCIAGKGGKHSLSHNYPKGGEVGRKKGVLQRLGGKKIIMSALPTGAMTQQYTGSIVRRGGKMIIGRSEKQYGTI